MFLLWKNILWLPIAFLYDLGEPFKWNNGGSSLRNLTERQIKNSYQEARFKHYFTRIILSGAFIVGCLIFALAVYVSDGYVLILFPLVTLVVLLIDGMMMFARFIYHQEKVKESEARNEVVVVGFWKDTSLNGVLRERNEARKKFAEEYKEKTGKEPSGYDYERALEGRSSY